MTNDNLSKEERRIQELGDKSSQTLLFLSFALVVVATLKGKSDASRQVELKQAMYWWSWALFPVLAGILPIKEFGEGKIAWYRVVRWYKVVLLWTAILMIGWGAWKFSGAISQVFLTSVYFEYQQVFWVMSTA
jgi:hypothetical protein